ncbi:glycosyltransferase family 2 protein [Halalkaliarchaeum sp. AArc-GB]|uniref:glycosyltransferase family 2 protein n=1 Tax=Halalkaliarchaeum sp. AArc-GB TaxID=3074078 RepID=UPI00285688DA|nr:glycosyltransferase family 2 protein [Halalkaliarchaeum sp. AArc-GB]MDR5674215.1 glycosyltransferase family 2 protein [Halalkaliarchaeum sp. AArc-GB]
MVSGGPPWIAGASALPTGSIFGEKSGRDGSIIQSSSFTPEGSSPASPQSKYDKMPQASVITATYNRATTLPRAIESVLSQSFGDFEYIIVDDGSDDGTEEVVEEYDDDRIKYIQLQNNRGANIARNIGIKKASGNYISILDSDDEYHPKRLEKTISRLNSLSDEFGAVYHSYQRVQDNQMLGVRRTKNQELTLDDLRHGNEIGSFLAVTFRSEVFEEVGILDEEMVAGQDYEFYLRMAKHFKFKGISDCLATYHLSPDAISSIFDRKQKANEQLLCRHGDILSDKRHAKHYYSRFFIHIHDDDIDSARSALIKSIQYNPYFLLPYYYLFFTLMGKTGFEFGDQIKRYINKFLLLVVNVFELQETPDGHQTLK